MSRNDRLQSAWKLVPLPRTFDARLRLAPRAAVAVAALLLVIAAGGQWMATARLRAVQRSAATAAMDLRTVWTLAGHIHDVLSAPVPLSVRLARADSLADQLRATLAASDAPSLAAVEPRFAVYYREARLAAQGLRMSGEGDAASADVSHASRLLDQQLRTAAGDAQRTLDAGLDSVAEMQSLLAWTLLLAGALSLALLATLGRAAVETVSESLDRATAAVNALATGEPGPVIPDAESGPMGELHDALRRLGKQVRTNSETAHALAAGAFRRATVSRVPDDPTGVALLQLTRQMESIASAAHRIARGDLTARVAPQSDDDAFGESVAAMLRRVKNVLREVQETRDGLSATVARMKQDSTALASATSQEADTLRRMLEQVTLVNLQAQADVGRGAALVARFDEGVAMSAVSAASLQASTGAVREVLHRSAIVQRLAADAGLLAAKAGSAAPADSAPPRTGDAAVDEARQLARQVAAAGAAVTRMMIDGSERAHECGVALDRAALAAREGATLARELDAAARLRAERLADVDGALVQARETASQSAGTARQLAEQLDVLCGHVRRLDGVMRRFGSRDAAVTAAPPFPRLADMSSVGGYETPPHAFMAFPRLALTGR